MKNLFTIGEMAELFGINIRTLRYYDGIGILRPETTDPETGYRYYSTRQFERLNTIKYLRALGVSLKKISLFLKTGMWILCWDCSKNRGKKHRQKSVN